MTQFTLITTGVVIFVTVLIVGILRRRNKREENTKRESCFKAKVNRNEHPYEKLNNKIKNLEFMIEKNLLEIAEIRSQVNKKC